MNKLSTQEHQIYMPGSNGPFRCDNCRYFIGSSLCTNKKIIKLAIDGNFGLTMSNGLAKVDPSGCSDEFKRK